MSTALASILNLADSLATKLKVTRTTVILGFWAVLIGVAIWVWKRGK